MAKHALQGVENIAEGECELQQVAGQKLMVYRLSDGVFATSHQCTHLFKSLKNGVIASDQTIECPLHKAKFDIRTGEVSEWACFPKGIVNVINAVRKEKSLETFAVTQEGGEYFVELPQV